MSKRTIKLSESQLKNMISESVRRILKEERYMSDENIAAQYSDMKIIEFVLEHARTFDGWTGRFNIEFPNADDIDYNEYMVNNFIAYDMDGNRIAWDNWMPEEDTQYLEDIIRKEIAKRKGGVVESVLKEEEYVDNAADTNMKVVGFELKPAEEFGFDFDGWVGRFKVEAPSVDGSGYKDTLINTFIAYGEDGDTIAWDDEMPEEATNYLEDIIRKAIAKRKGVIESKLNEIGDTPKGQRKLGGLHARKVYSGDPNAKDIHDFAQERAGGWEPDGKGQMDNPLYYDHAQGYIDYENAHPDEVMGDWVAEAVSRKLNEIGDTSRGQYMLGRLDARNIKDKDENPDGKHATYRGDAFDAAARNKDGNATEDFYQGAKDERGGDRYKTKREYDTRSMNDRHRMGGKFIRFIEGDDKVLQMIREYESEGKDAFEAAMDAFEDKLGYTLTDRTRQICKNSYYEWWYYAAAELMGESKVKKITDMIVESIKGKLNEGAFAANIESGHTNISDKVFNTLYAKFHGNDAIESYMEEISDIPMEITATIENVSDPESGYDGYEINDVRGGDDIMNAIRSKGIPEDVANMFCDTVAEVMGGLEYDDFEKEEIGPEEPERLGECMKRLLKEMFYGGEAHNLASFIDREHEEWLRRGNSEESWNDEGIVWTVQKYYSSMGAFSEEDWKTLEELGLEEIGGACEEDFAEETENNEI